jgi:hypothetical protein
MLRLPPLLLSPQQNLKHRKHRDETLKTPIRIDKRQPQNVPQPERPSHKRQTHPNQTQNQQSTKTRNLRNYCRNQSRRNRKSPKRRKIIHHTQQNHKRPKNRHLRIKTPQIRPPHQTTKPQPHLNIPTIPTRTLRQQTLNIKRTLLKSPHLRSITNHITPLHKLNRKLCILTQTILIPTANGIQRLTTDKLTSPSQTHIQIQRILSTQINLILNCTLIRNKPRQHILLLINRTDAPLNRPNRRIHKIRHSTQNRIRLRNAVTIKSRHNLTTSVKQTKIKRTRLSRRKRPINNPEPGTHSTEITTDRSGPIRRSVINHDNLPPIHGIIQTRQSRQQPSHNLLLILHRNHNRNKRKLTPPTLSTLRLLPTAPPQTPETSNHNRHIVNRKREEQQKYKREKQKHGTQSCSNRPAKPKKHTNHKRPEPKRKTPSWINRRKASAH